MGISAQNHVHGLFSHIFNKPKEREGERESENKNVIAQGSACSHGARSSRAPDATGNGEHCSRSHVQCSN